MDKAEIQQIPDEAEQMQAAKRHGGKWRVLLIAVLVAAAIAAVFYFKQPGLDKQLRVLASGRGGLYKEEVRGPGWYVKLAEKYKLPVLKRPDMFQSQMVTDEDMAVVGKANSLRVVVLHNSEISDAGLAYLEGLTKLKHLDLCNTKIGNAGLVHLKKLKNLQGLILNDTEVTDTGLAHLSELIGLRVLNLGATNVTDAGIVHLKSLKGLTYLELTKTHVTAEGVADLKSAIPNVKVEFK